MTTVRRGEHRILAGPLYLLTGIAAMAGALVAYWLIHEVVGYHGGKSVVFHIGGLVAGGYMAWPLWWLYRRHRPEARAKQE